MVRKLPKKSLKVAEVGVWSLRKEAVSITKKYKVYDPFNVLLDSVC